MTEAFGPVDALALEDLEWLRRLAARLVRDPHTAEDAVQDTLVSALERGPARGSSPRAWLARVLRNALRQEWRGRARRARREAGVDARPGEREPHEVVAELALHRRLADEVERLGEPYRTAVLLRYLRGAEVRAIAQELGVPEKTVRSRLERGLAQLRERLGRDREPWLACLALARPAVPAVPQPLPWLLTMNLKLVSALAGISVLGVWFVLRESPAQAEPPRSRSAETITTATDAPGLPVERASARESLPTDSAPGMSAPESTHAPQAALVSGSVRTLDGAGVALEVVFRPEDESAADLRVRSAADGRFELPLPAARGRIGVDDARYACVVGPYLSGSLPLEEAIVVVAPGVDFAGLVRAADGSPLEGTSVALTLPGSIVQSRDVGGSAVHLLLPLVETRTDAAGLFRCARTGFVEGLELVARAEGHEEAHLALPARSDKRLEIVLTPRAASSTLHGLVLAASGAPAAGALVSLGTTVVACGSDGRFTLEREPWRQGGWVRAVAPGALPAELALDELRPASSPEDPLVLTLGAPPARLVGRVVDAAGEPVPFAEVFTPDTTPFGQVEFEENGRAVSAETTLEAFLADQRGLGELCVAARADGAGRFELSGLLARPYAVFALDARTLAGAGPVEAWPGSGEVELVLATEELRHVAGRVVSRSGQPLAGVSVRLARELPWEPDASRRGARWMGFHLPAPAATRSLRASAATTDAEGRFDLGRIASESASLVLRGPALALGAVQTLAPEQALDALELTVEAATRFQVHLRHPAEADAFALLDSTGEERAVFLEVDGLTMTAVRPALESGRSGTVLAREGEYTLVLFRAAQEVRREPLTLAPGGLFELEF